MYLNLLMQRNRKNIFVSKINNWFLDSFTIKNVSNISVCGPMLSLSKFSITLLMLLVSFLFYNAFSLKFRILFMSNSFTVTLIFKNFLILKVVTLLLNYASRYSKPSNSSRLIKFEVQCKVFYSLYYKLNFYEKHHEIAEYCKYNPSTLNLIKTTVIRPYATSYNDCLNYGPVLSLKRQFYLIIMTLKYNKSFNNLIKMFHLIFQNASCNYNLSSYNYSAPSNGSIRRIFLKLILNCLLIISNMITITSRMNLNLSLKTLKVSKQTNVFVYRELIETVLSISVYQTIYSLWIFSIAYVILIPLMSYFILGSIYTPYLSANISLIKQ